MIVTSATSAFKENIDLDEEDDEELAGHAPNRPQFAEEVNGVSENNEALHKAPAHSSTATTKSKSAGKLSVQDSNNNQNEQQTGAVQQDEWEEFEDANSKYQQLRLKFGRGGGNEQNNGDDDDDDEYYDGGHYNDGNTDENLVGDDGEQSSRANRRREQQQKEKPAWKLDQVQPVDAQTGEDVTDSPAEKADEPAKPTVSSSSAYRPPALRNNSSVTVVSGLNQRSSKKEKPNLASKEEFPTLGAAVNKK